jgi:hypothetical protein
LSFPDRDNRHHQRHQARHEICLRADLSLFDTQTTIAQEQEKSLTIFGSTYDLSAAGVSVIVPLISIDERYCYDEDKTLPLMLYLPTGQVNMQIAPVRCLPLDEKEPGKGFFMGARIAQIEDYERRRLVEYLHTITN